MYQNFIIPYLYEAQHVSGNTPPIIRSLKLQWQPLVFHMWKADGRCQVQYVPDNVHQLHVPSIFHVWKTKRCQCSFRLLMMGGVSPNTCWASYKYGITKFWYTVASCWIFLYELYCDVRIHKHQCSVSVYKPEPHLERDLLHETCNIWDDTLSKKQINKIVKVHNTHTHLEL